VEDDNTATGMRKHLSDKDAWLRLLYMILFGIAFELVKFITFFVAAIQMLFKLFTGGVQPRLSGLGASLAVFLSQTVDFLTFRSEAKPFPWSAWPVPEAIAPPAAAAEPAAPEASGGEADAAPRRARRGGRRKTGGPAGDDIKTE